LYGVPPSPTPLLPELPDEIPEDVPLWPPVAEPLAPDAVPLAPDVPLPLWPLAARPLDPDEVPLFWPDVEASPELWPELVAASPATLPDVVTLAPLEDPGPPSLEQPTATGARRAEISAMGFIGILGIAIGVAIARPSLTTRAMATATATVNGVDPGCSSERCALRCRRQRQ
jgi:hypothetical protein